MPKISRADKELAKRLLISALDVGVEAEYQSCWWRGPPEETKDAILEYIPGLIRKIEKKFLKVDKDD